MPRHGKRGRRGYGRMSKFAPAGFRRPKYNVPVNIREDAHGYTAHVFCVGFPKEGIEVSVIGNTLYITGKRTPADDPDPDFLLQEYPIKSFERSFELSHQVDKQAIRAKLADGVLTITVAKTEAAREDELRVPVE
jgi:HSP20 family protein